jgi:lipopolysaccharide export system permease protein
MGIVERYILRGSFIAFAASLTVLTAIVWVSQALREVDLMTGKGQTILVFLSVTALTIPSLVSVIAPIALFAAVLYILNKLNGDSELVVMTAAGMSPARLARPFIILAVAVSLVVGVMSTWAMPASYRQIRDVLSKVRADFLTYLVREGQFVTLDQGFVFHYRERGAQGALLGIFIQDRRDAEKISTYIAEAGVTTSSGDNNFLVLEKGYVHRQERNEKSSAIVQFESYALDLAQFAGGSEAGALRPRERTTLDLLTLTPANADSFARQYFGRFRAELHERLSAPLYVLAFALIAFAALGQARTTRQGRGAAIVAAIAIVLALRVAGIAASNLSARSAGAVALVYALPIGGILAALFYTFGGLPVRVRQVIARLRPNRAQPA